MPMFVLSPSKEGTEASILLLSVWQGYKGKPIRGTSASPIRSPIVVLSSLSHSHPPDPNRRANNSIKCTSRWALNIWTPLISRKAVLVGLSIDSPANFACPILSPVWRQKKHVQFLSWISNHLKSPKIKRKTKLGKVISAFHRSKMVSNRTYNLLWDGEKILDDQTPEELDMDEGSVLDAFLEALGGDGVK